MVATYPIEEGREKKRAALLSVGSALLLVSLKTFLVVRTGSLGVLSEALHSGLDLLAAIITFLSVRMSDQPADEKHPYGHGKFENFSALLEAAPQGLQQEIAKAVAHMDGVLDVDRVRVRRAGNRHFVDATVSVARTASLEQVHALSDAIEKRIGQIVPSDVMVHAEPRAPQGEHHIRRNDLADALLDGVA